MRRSVWGAGRRLHLGALSLAVAATFAVASATAAENNPVEKANKQVVLDFYAALNQADATNTMKERIAGIAETYLSPAYVQHSETFAGLPGAGADRERLVSRLQNAPSRGPNPAPAPKTVSIMAEGDRVMLLTSRDRTDPATGAVKTSYIFNMFRVKDGKLVEHWDVMPADNGSR